MKIWFQAFTFSFTTLAFLFVLLPLHVYHYNQGDLDIQPAVILAYGALLSLVCSLVLSLCFFAFRAARTLKATSAFLALALFVFIVFLPSKYGALTGADKSFDAWTVGLELLMYGAVLLLLALFFWKQRVLFMTTFFASAFCSGLMVVYFTFSIGTHRLFGPLSENLESLVDLGKENIIVIIHDGYSGASFHNLIEDNASGLEELSGFIFYKNAIAQVPNTGFAMPMIFNGNYELESDAVTHQWYYALQDSLFEDVLKNGYSAKYIAGVSFSLLAHYCKEKKAEGLDCFTLDDVLEKKLPSTLLEANQFLGVFLQSLRRIIPVYFSDSLFEAIYRVARRGPSAEVNLDVLGVETKAVVGTTIAYDKLINNLRIGKKEKVLLFFHTRITHNPYHFDDQGEICLDCKYDSFNSVLGAFKRDVRLIQKLKELGVYDDTTIILSADHGSTKHRGRFYGDLDLEKRILHVPGLIWYNPLLLVKPAGSDGPVTINSSAVTLSDIRWGIKESLGGYDADFSILNRAKNQRDKISAKIYSTYEGFGWTTKEKWTSHALDGGLADIQHILAIDESLKPGDVLSLQLRDSWLTVTANDAPLTSLYISNKNLPCLGMLVDESGHYFFEKNARLTQIKKTISKYKSAGENYDLFIYTFKNQGAFLPQSLPDIFPESPTLTTDQLNPELPFAVHVASRNGTTEVDVEQAPGLTEQLRFTYQ